MKKILFILVVGLLITAFALPVLATTSTTTISTTVDLTAMQAAVEKRDSAIIASWDKYSAAARSSLDARKTALKSAWTITDAKQRSVAIKSAWTNYKNTIKAARKTFATEKKAAWKQYKIDSKAARGTSYDSTGESVDNSL